MPLNQLQTQLWIQCHVKLKATLQEEREICATLTAVIKYHNI